MTLQQEVQIRKAALRKMAKALGYQLTIEADDSGGLEYFLKGGQAYRGDKFFAGLDIYEVLEALEAYASGHENYAEALAEFKIATGGNQ